jgi:preprotein translocase subunit YajC
MMLLPFVLLFGLIWWMQRGEKKKRSELEGKLKKGDRIITRAGFIGKLTELGERTARVELAPGVNITMLRSHIEGLDGGDTTPASKSSAGKSSKAADSKKKKK